VSSLKAAPNSYTGSAPPRPFAGAWRRSAHRLTPKKLMRSPRRLFKTTGSRSEKRSQLVPSSTRGQPQDQGSYSDLSMENGRAVPGSNPSDEVGNSGEREQTGSLSQLSLQLPQNALVPGLPPLGALALPARSAWSLYGSFIGSSPICPAPSHGTGRPRRSHNSSTAAYSGCRVSARP
jgi:hypothetical protein